MGRKFVQCANTHAHTRPQNRCLRSRPSGLLGRLMEKNTKLQPGLMFSSNNLS